MLQSSWTIWMIRPRVGIFIRLFIGVTLSMTLGSTSGQEANRAGSPKQTTDQRATATKRPPDRTTMGIPLPRDWAGLGQRDAVSSAVSMNPAGVMNPAEAMKAAASEGWHAYQRLWDEHRRDPASANIRRFLGLPLDGTIDFSARRGRTAPSWLGWRPGSFAQVDTPHFVILSQADRSASQAVAEDLERCYWVWTQLFFPLWESSAQVTAALSGWPVDQNADEFLEEKRSRLTMRRKLQVVLFRSAADYAKTLGRDVPGIERSTGFYSDTRRAVCLYAPEQKELDERTGFSVGDDPETRRHELVHQLFREATRNRLGRSMPGEREGFWLVEGIAGYCESMMIGDDRASVGGWDSPRLQFSRYRVLVGGDTMSIGELDADGRAAAQQRQDIARWYSQSITQVHRLMDSGNVQHRIWLYRRLADLYRIEADFGSDQVPGDRSGGDDPVDLPPDDEARNLTRFLKVDDSHLLANPTTRMLQSLCLANCEVTSAGLASIGQAESIEWLDLSRLPIGDDALRALAPEPTGLRQLSLEATKVGPGLADWIARSPELAELDASWTLVDDSVVRSIANVASMRVLWLTGSKITDASIPKILTMQNLESIDVQRSGVSNRGVDQLGRLPAADVNPLKLIATQPNAPESAPKDSAP